MALALRCQLSISISKTVNIPSESTVEDIKNIYVDGWKLGLKAIALYRDGCKSSQPLNTAMSTETQESEADKSAEAIAVQEKAAAAKAELKAMPVIEAFPRGKRMPLPQERKGTTVESRIGGHKVFLRTGEYSDGVLGEIFVDMHKEGAAFRSMMNCFAISVSIGLQHGVPLEKFVDIFTFTRFEPNGMTNHPNIRSATSVVDFVFRFLGMKYLGRTDFVHVKPVDPTPMELSQPLDTSVRQTEGTVSAGANVEISSSIIGESHGGSVLDKQLSEMMGDAPACNECGHITVRNGSCYKCLNCGNSMGCS